MRSRGTKSFGAILAIAIIALVFFAIGAYTLSESSPKVRIKKVVERALPVTVDGVDVVRDPVSRRGRLIIRATPQGATLTALDAAQIAARAAEVFKSSDVIPIDFEILDVAAPAGVIATFERAGIERRVAMEMRLPELAATLAAAWGTRPDVRVMDQYGEFGIALAARPPGRDDRTIAQDIFNSGVGFSFVLLPAPSPGTAPVTVRRGRR